MRHEGAHELALPNTTMQLEQAHGGELAVLLHAELFIGQQLPPGRRVAEQRQKGCAVRWRAVRRVSQQQNTAARDACRRQRGQLMRSLLFVQAVGKKQQVNVLQQLSWRRAPVQRQRKNAASSGRRLPACQQAVGQSFPLREGKAVGGNTASHTGQRVVLRVCKHCGLGTAKCRSQARQAKPAAAVQHAAGERQRRARVQASSKCPAAGPHAAKERIRVLPVRCNESIEDVVFVFRNKQSDSAA